jgi:hypothetical protein
LAIRETPATGVAVEVVIPLTRRPATLDQSVAVA